MISDCNGRRDFFNKLLGKLNANAAVEGGKYPFFTCSRDDHAIDTFSFDCEALLLSGNNGSADFSVKHFKGKFNAYQRTYVLTLEDQHHSYPFFRQLLEYKLGEMKRGSRGTGIKYLTLDFFRRFELPVPPPDVQANFAQMLEEKSAVARKMAEAELASNDLYNSLVHRAFSGKLQ